MRETIVEPRVRDLFTPDQQAMIDGIFRGSPHVHTWVNVQRTAGVL